MFKAFLFGILFLGIVPTVHAGICQQIIEGYLKDKPELIDLVEKEISELKGKKKGDLLEMISKFQKALAEADDTRDLNHTEVSFAFNNEIVPVLHTLVQRDLAKKAALQLGVDVDKIYADLLTKRNVLVEAIENLQKELKGLSELGNEIYASNRTAASINDSKLDQSYLDYWSNYRIFVSSFAVYKDSIPGYDILLSRAGFTEHLHLDSAEIFFLYNNSDKIINGLDQKLKVLKKVDVAFINDLKEKDLDSLVDYLIRWEQPAFVFEETQVGVVTEP